MLDISIAQVAPNLSSLNACETAILTKENFCAKKGDKLLIHLPLKD
jgi:hypothetical protein